MKAIFEKSTYSGNRAESMTQPDANGGAWQITTHKTSRGQVVCSAVAGHLDNSMFSYEMFGARRLTLASNPGKATEKLVRETHEQGLAEFTRVMSEEKETAPAPYVIQVGQIVYTDGPFESARRAVCEILRPGKYKTVLLDGSGFRFDDYMKPIAQKFGIGTYYAEGDTITAEEVAALVEAARDNEQIKSAAKQLEEVEKEAARIQAIEAGRKVIPEIPAGAVAVIVAELHKDESDSQSDYRGHSTESVVYLSFSGHDRDLFPEMRKAADKFEGTAHLGTGKGIFTPFLRNMDTSDFHFNGSLEYAGCELRRVGGIIPDEVPTFTTRAEAEQYITNNPPKVDTVQSDDGRAVPIGWDVHEKEIEHREKYSMGAGFYLGGSSYESGWIVRKSTIDASKQMLEKLQIAAAHGRFLCNVEELKEEKTAPAIEAPAVVNGEISIIDYSEKAFAVIGDTKPIKDKLKDIGGSFNARLRCGPGWIFSKKRLEAVQKFLNNLSAAA